MNYYTWLLCMHTFMHVQCCPNNDLIYYRYLCFSLDCQQVVGSHLLLVFYQTFLGKLLRNKCVLDNMIHFSVNICMLITQF